MPTISNLNHQTIKGLETADGEDYTEYWQEDFPQGSFGVRVSGRTGKKKFVLRYRNQHGQKRRLTLGAFAGSSSAGLSLSAARDQALQVVGDVAAGEDPAETDNADAPETVRQLVETFLEVHGQNLADLTLRDYKQYFSKDVLPRFFPSNMTQ